MIWLVAGACGSSSAQSVPDAAHRIVDAAATGDASRHDAGSSAGPDAGLADGVTIVQQAQNSAGLATSLTATFATPPVAGHLLIMVGGDSNGNNDVIAGAGSGWTRAAGSYVNSNVEIWFAVASGDGASVTMSSAKAPDNMFMSISEWSGLASADPLDIAAPPPPNGSDDGGAGNASAIPLTTSGTDLLLFAVSSSSPQPFGPPTSAWDQVQPVVGSLVVEGFCEVMPAGTYQPEVASPGSWDAAFAAFKTE